MLATEPSNTDNSGATVSWAPPCGARAVLLLSLALNMTLLAAVGTVRNQAIDAVMTVGSSDYSESEAAPDTQGAEGASLVPVGPRADGAAASEADSVPLAAPSVPSWCGGRRQAVIVTGASQNHAITLQRALLDSVLQGDGLQRVIVYDLGLQPASAAAVEAHPAVAQLRRFNFSAHPPHVNITVARGQYAWKPAIINEVLQECEAVLWLDAGTTVPAGRGASGGASMTAMFSRIRREGMVSGTSSGNIAKWTHPGTLARVARDAAVRRGSTEPSKATFPSRLLSRPNCNGALLGFARHHAAYAAVFQPWLACAREESCIAPPGSSRTNHRQDQAALSAVVALAGERFQRACVDEPNQGSLAGWRTHQDGAVQVAERRRLSGILDDRRGTRRGLR
jgi:hypothetical protein